MASCRVHLASNSAMIFGREERPLLGLLLLCVLLLQELEVSPTDFDKVLTELAANGVTLREIKDATSLAYNQIRAVIAVLIQGYGEHN